ncbi:Carboxylesterase type B [Macrophomina phaseolina MS6]|uniref:Carboxylesterase type B n=1 Tax=Macrophomina phaseolina (strain MS6) TaxID=1126212 RepID=K2RQV7_MACPH|nr:Carboxylesterase type B [Macrophomina phaseolina MS6]
MRSFAPWIALALSVLASAQNSSSLPIVDLGYELYRASGFNETRQYYNFSNIRYAAPPTGDLRFKAPQAPATNRSVINDGSIGRICPQPPSSSSSSEAAFLLNYLATGQIATNTTSSTTSSSNSTTDPRETEDCLFLDVIVPEKVFTNAGQGDGAPVLVWIHGTETA